jgi:serine/threonine protein kinase
MPLYGISLSEYINYRRGIARHMHYDMPLFTSEILHIWEQLLDATGHCHAHRIVHRGMLSKHPFPFPPTVPASTTFVV